MKRMLFAAVTMFMLLALSGCGGGGSSPPPTFVTQITSDPAVDGDIELNDGVFTTTQGTTSTLLAGLDPLVIGSEFRAFLDFPLTGSVPLGALIDSATLDIFIVSVDSAANSVPIRIELVSFPPLDLRGVDFAQPALIDAAIVAPIFQADVGRNVSIDVTPLLAEAQRRGLANFQIRILENFGPVTPGVVEIDETGVRAPLLEVVYF
jgi:hypothetical protein